MAHTLGVAPHWGAWIEIRHLRGTEIRNSRSHPTGVRGLKYDQRVRPEEIRLVAPHWGAWIEIPSPSRTARPASSHPTGVRGLKLPCSYHSHMCSVSHPTGVRGLKYQPDRNQSQRVQVAPHWGAWIEMYTIPADATGTITSHPTGVRGLKYVQERETILGDRRTPLGCVD